MTLQPITVSELVKKILKSEPVFILDVRKTEDYEDWFIEGENVESINIPFKQIENKELEVKRQLPDDQPIYVVCARGISSQKIVEKLASVGIEKITYVIGGMTAWSEHLEPIKIDDLPGKGTMYQFVRIGKGCLSYLIESKGEVAIVDPSRMIDKYLDFINEKGWTIKAVIDTHLHADHISGAVELSKRAGATYWFPSKDDMEVTYKYNPLEHEKIINIGDVSIEPIYSPGHTMGSTSLIVDNQFLLTGDILFVESIGRPDLAGKAGEWVNDLRETLFERYDRLAKDLMVLPAHFSKMSELNEDGSIKDNLASLYQKNEQLQVEDQERFKHMVTDNLPPQPHSYQEIREINMGKEHPDADEKKEMEIGPNRCAIS